MNIRKADNTDIEAIKEVIFEVLEEYGLQPDPESTDSDLSDIEGNYILNGGYFGVIEENGKVVATVGIYKVSAHVCELRKMYMLSSLRGKGIGKKLIEFALAEAKELGFTKVVLETASQLVEAIALYKKYGFTEYQSDHLVPRCDQAFELEL